MKYLPSLGPFFALVIYDVPGYKSVEALVPVFQLVACGSFIQRLACIARYLYNLYIIQNYSEKYNQWKSK